MGSSSKGGDQNWDQIAGRQGYEQYGTGAQRIQPGEQHYEAYNQGWMMRQQEQEQQEGFQEMFSAMMEPPPPPPTPEELAAQRWESDKFEKGASFGDIQSQLGSLEEGEYYTFRPTAAPGVETPTGSTDPNMPVGTVTFSGEMTGPEAWQKSSDINWEDAGYGYTSEGESLADVVGRRDEAIGRYLEAGQSATDIVSGQIDKERSDAALLGVDYTITDETKKQRISDEFAGMWSASEQESLEKMADQFGGMEQIRDPFGEWMFERGTATDPTEAEYTEELQGTTGTATGASLLEEEESASLLGV